MRASAYTAILGGLFGLSSAAVLSPSAVELKPISPNAFVPGLAPRSQGEGPTVLRPINSDIFDAMNGLKPRTDVDFSKLDPAEQAQLIFGAQGGNGNIMLANMTLYAPGGQQIVMMETFEGLTSSVDCKGDDGEMALTFKSRDAFNYAHEKWSFINEKPEYSFLLIANHDGCGPDDQRQAYNITEIHNVEGTLTTLLKASPASWRDISGTFDLDFGTVSLTHDVARRLRARGIIDDLSEGASNIVNNIKDGVKDTVDEIKGGLGDLEDIFKKIGDANLDKTVVFDIGVGTQGKRTNIITDVLKTVPRLVIDCVDCFIAGKFKVVGRLSVDNFVVKNLTLGASPQDFRAKMVLEAKVADKIASLPPSLNLTKELASFPIPGAGIEIPGIFELGAIISYEVGVECTVNGAANFTFGLGATLPNTAIVAINLADLTKTKATGFDGATFSPVFDLNSGSATLNVAAVSRPKLTFGIEVVGVGKLKAALKMGLPVVNVQLTAAFDEGGVCEKSPTASKTGFKVNSGVAVELGFSVDGTLGTKSAGLFERNIFRFKKILFEKCFPLSIPNLLKTGPKPRQLSGPQPDGPSLPRRSSPPQGPGSGARSGDYHGPRNGTKSGGYQGPRNGTKSGDYQGPRNGTKSGDYPPPKSNCSEPTKNSTTPAPTGRRVTLRALRFSF